MAADIVSREVLRHHPGNAVTAVVERLTRSDGTTVVHKRLRPPAPTGAPSGANGPWAGSTDPRHWNSWRREADAYRSEELRAGLVGTGLGMAAATVEEAPDGIDLWLEDVAGTPGPAFTLDDHAALAAGLGRWQAGGPLLAPWTSQRWLRQYSTSAGSCPGTCSTTTPPGRPRSSPATGRAGCARGGRG